MAITGSPEQKGWGGEWGGQGLGFDRELTSVGSPEQAARRAAQWLCIEGRGRKGQAWVPVWEVDGFTVGMRFTFLLKEGLGGSSVVSASEGLCWSCLPPAGPTCCLSACSRPVWTPHPAPHDQQQGTSLCHTSLHSFCRGRDPGGQRPHSSFPPLHRPARPAAESHWVQAGSPVPSMLSHFSTARWSLLTVPCPTAMQQGTWTVSCLGRRWHSCGTSPLPWQVEVKCRMRAPEPFSAGKRTSPPSTSQTSPTCCGMATQMQGKGVC